ISTASTPTPSAWRASSIASLVPAAPTPTTSGTRPPTIVFTSSMKCLRSSLARCEASPVLPKGEMPSTPASIKRSTTASVAPRSTSPRSSKGVTIAGINPVSIVSSPLYGPGEVPSPLSSSSYGASYKNSSRWVQPRSTRVGAGKGLPTSDASTKSLLGIPLGVAYPKCQRGTGYKYDTADGKIVLYPQVLARRFRVLLTRARGKDPSGSRCHQLVTDDNSVVHEEMYLFRSLVRHPDLWAVVRLWQVGVVLSEDFNLGTVLDGVSFTNPLDPEFDLAALG